MSRKYSGAIFVHFLWRLHMKLILEMLTSFLIYFRNVFFNKCNGEEKTIGRNIAGLTEEKRDKLLSLLRPLCDADRDTCFDIIDELVREREMNCRRKALLETSDDMVSPVSPAGDRAELNKQILHLSLSEGLTYRESFGRILSRRAEAPQYR